MTVPGGAIVQIKGRGQHLFGRTCRSDIGRVKKSVVRIAITGQVPSGKSLREIQIRACPVHCRKPDGFDHIGVKRAK